MASARRITLHLLLYSLLSLAALGMAIFLGGAFLPLDLYEEKSSGREEQRFYLLLLDQAYLHSIKGREHFLHWGMDEENRRKFESMLNAIHYKRDCRLDGSQVVGRGISCDVHGRWIDFIEYGGH